MFLFPALFDRVFGFSQFVSLQFFIGVRDSVDQSDLISNTIDVDFTMLRNVAVFLHVFTGE